MYYTDNTFDKAKELALNNGQDYHLAAILIRNRKQIIRVGTNSKKTHPKFARMFKDGKVCGYLHAEMDVLRFAKPGDILYVFRFLSNGKMSMAKPCPYCQKAIENSEIDRVIFSNWNGELEELREV